MSRPSFTPVPIFLSPQPRHILDASADPGSRGKADRIYNGLLSRAHSSGNVRRLCPNSYSLMYTLLTRTPANEFAGQACEC